MEWCSPRAWWDSGFESLHRTNRDWVREFNGERAALLSGWPYLIVRGILAALMLLLMIMAIAESVSANHWPVQLTSWTIMLETLFFLVSVGASHRAVTHVRSKAVELSSDPVQVKVEQKQMVPMYIQNPSSPGGGIQLYPPSSPLGAPPGFFGAPTMPQTFDGVAHGESLAPGYINENVPDKASLVDVENDGPPPLLIVAHTYLFATAWTMELMISILYWTLLAPHRSCEEKTSMSYLAHGGTNILMIIDTIFAGHTFHIVRVWPAAAFSIAYTIFSRIYALAGGRDSDGNGYIYPVLDWNNGEMSASLMCIILIVVGIPICALIAWAFCRLRRLCIPPRKA